MGIQGTSGDRLRAVVAPSLPRPRPEGQSEGSTPGSTARRAESSDSTQRADAAQRPRHKQTTEVPGAERAGTRLHVDEATDRVVAQILDAKKEVIKQIPEEKQLEVIRRTRQLQGLLFDEFA